MHKMILLLLSATCLIAGCNNVDTSRSSERIAELSQTIEQLRGENSRLQQELSLEQERTDDEQTRSNLRETLNMTFRLLAAMNSGDTAYIESVSSPNVKISEKGDAIIVRNGNTSHESQFIKNVQWDEFEFRGFDSKDANHAMLFVAHIITTKGSEGNIAYEFSFIRSPEGKWLFDGFVS